MSEIVVNQRFDQAYEWVMPHPGCTRHFSRHFVGREVPTSRQLRIRATGVGHHVRVRPFRNRSEVSPFGRENRLRTSAA
jgi:hypothetical protein